MLVYCHCNLVFSVLRFLIYHLLYHLIIFFWVHIRSKKKKVLSCSWMLVMREGTSLKTAANRNPTHTRLYLRFESNHPIDKKWFIGLLYCYNNQKKWLNYTLIQKDALSNAVSKQTKMYYIMPSLSRPRPIPSVQYSNV